MSAKELRERLAALGKERVVERHGRLLATPESCNPHAQRCYDLARDAVEQFERTEAALVRIRDLDYRGNRHESAYIASGAISGSREVTK